MPAGARAAVWVPVGCVCRVCRTLDASMPAVLPHPIYLEGRPPAQGLRPVPHSQAGLGELPAAGN